MIFLFLMFCSSSSKKFLGTRQSISCSNSHSELSPTNTLVNVTGLGSQELMDAMNVLYQGNKIAQKTEKNIVTIPMQSGIMTQEVKTVSIASNERVEEQKNKESADKTVFISILIVSLIIIMILVNTFILKNRIGWK